MSETADEQHDSIQITIIHGNHKCVARRTLMKMALINLPVEEDDEAIITIIRTGTDSGLDSGRHVSGRTAPSGLLDGEVSSDGQSRIKTSTQTVFNS